MKYLKPSKKRCCARQARTSGARKKPRLPFVELPLISTSCTFLCPPREVAGTLLCGSWSTRRHVGEEGQSVCRGPARDGYGRAVRNIRRLSRLTGKAFGALAQTRICGWMVRSVYCKLWYSRDRDYDEKALRLQRQGSFSKARKNAAYKIMRRVYADSHNSSSTTHVFFLLNVFNYLSYYLLINS